MARDLAVRIDLEARALHNSTVSVVLNLVLRGGWLVPDETKEGANGGSCVGGSTPHIKTAERS